jgi:hypothetical protein
MPIAMKKITVNVPPKVLERAREITGRGVTETIVQGLLEIDRQHKLTTLRALRGRVHFDLDLAKTRR